MTGSHYPEVPKFVSVGVASATVKGRGFPCYGEIPNSFVLMPMVPPVSRMD